MKAPRVAAIDLGKSRVGIAVADDLGLYSHARPFLDAKNKKALVAALVKLAKDEKLEQFVLGLPLEMRGEDGPAARRARLFAQELADASGLPVELVDERLSTVEASRGLRAGGVDARRGKSKIDGAAAAVVLQAWLDRRAEDHE